MKKIIYTIFIFFFLICFAFIFLKKDDDKKLLEDRIVTTKTGERLLEGYEEYTDIDINNNIFESRNQYLEISEEKEIFIRTEDKNDYFVEFDKNTGLEKKIIIDKKAKNFQFRNGYLYYVKRNSLEDKEELHKLDTIKNIDTVLVALEWIDEYILKENFIILVEMGLFHRYNVKTKEIVIIDVLAHIFDYEDEELFLYNEHTGKGFLERKGEVCFYKLKVPKRESIIEKNCDIKLSFVEGKEALAGKPIKLEKDIYIIKFAKIKKISIGHQYYSFFGIPIFRKPFFTTFKDTEYFFKIIDLKNKKVLSEKIKF